MGKTKAVTENMVLRKVFEPKREEITEDLENCIMKDFMIFTPPEILSG